ncbi:Protein of unknown function [Agreia bicolorata]|uniref:Membrane protein n=1 Tax=Agreia bicolorata TaxID=110935 RepID=A0A1T4X6P2_9MICO|nr:DUF3093 domain-containing protein [Agreia bicolorata]KJC65395.1 membrane protein [Agreia bicolorata]SKA85350.1 Protein of unknown function [Agreia bicolorata]
MSSYRERLWPSIWIYLATALVIPASILVLAPVNLTAGIIAAAVLFIGLTGIFIVLAPVIEVKDGMLIAGKAQIPLELLGTPSIFKGGAATLQRGQRLDARAWLCLRGWVDPVIKIPLEDPDDPTPYWLVSSRNPEGLAAALSA